MKDVITVTMDDGRSLEIEVITIFSLDKYNDRNYIVYTLGEKLENDQEKVYISILERDQDNFNLSSIEDSTEWEDVQLAVNELSKDDGEANE